MFRATIAAGALGGKIYLAIDEATQDVVGMSLWWGPGQDAFSTLVCRISWLPESDFFPTQRRATKTGILRLRLCVVRRNAEMV